VIYAGLAEPFRLTCRIDIAATHLMLNWLASANFHTSTERVTVAGLKNPSGPIQTSSADRTADISKTPLWRWAADFVLMIPVELMTLTPRSAR
jgi:hypothetical protein